MNVLDTINNAFPNLKNFNSTRQLPNGGGAYSIGNGSGSPVASSNVFDPAQAEAAANLFKTVPKSPVGGAPVGEPTQSQDISPEDLTNALNSRLYGISPANVPTAEQVSTRTPFQDYNAIREQMIQERLNGTGAYAIPPGMAYSPDQIRQVYNAADQAYGSRLSEISSVLQNQAGKKFGLDSIFAGLSPTTVNLISGQADKFGKEDGVLKFNIIQDSAIQSGQIINRLKGGPGTGADDQRLIYLFAKAQDPNSVVKEGEYKNAEQFLSTLPQSIASQISRVATIDKATGNIRISSIPTGFLTPDARKAINEALQEQYKGSKTTYDNLRNEYSRRINSYAGVNGLGEQMLVNYSGAYNNEQPGGSGSSVGPNGFAEQW